MDDHTDTYRSLIQHEDSLRSQRLGWMLTTNGFLFTALALATDSVENRVLPVAIAVVGLAISLSTMVGLHTNTRALAHLRATGEMHRSELISDGKTGMGTVAPVVGMSGSELSRSGLLKHAWILWIFELLYPWRFIPMVLAAVWVIVGVFAITGSF